MEIYKPIIFIGMERSGKSLLFNILANHPDTYWLSNLDTKWPSATIPVTLVRRMYAFWTKNRIFMTNPGAISLVQGGPIHPSECTAYWKKVFLWGTEDNYLIEDDYFDESSLTPRQRSRLVRDFRLRMALYGKRRLILEQAGFSLKIRLLNALFPGALFIHTIRNPFDNYYALVRRKAASSQKLWGIKIPGWQALLNEKPGKQAVMQLEGTLRIIDEDIAKIPNYESRYLRIQHEILVSEPRETMERILDFCGLEMTPKILSALTGIKKGKESQGIALSLTPEIAQVLTTLAMTYGYSILPYIEDL